MIRTTLTYLQWDLANLTYFSSKAVHKLRILAYVLHILEGLVACLRLPSEQVAVSG